MAAPALKLVDSSPAAPATKWLSVAEAAQRTGQTERHIRRLCGERWQGEGLAHIENGVWVVAESAIAAQIPAAAPSPQDELACLKDLTDAQRQEVFRRQKIVHRLQAAIAGALAMGRGKMAAITEFRQQLGREGQDVSQRNLYYWLERYETEKLKGLFDRRWKPASSPLDSEDAFFTILKGYYLSENEPSKKTAWEWACGYAQAQGIPIHPYHKAKIFLSALPDATIGRYRGGETEFNDKHSPYIQRSYREMHSNEEWVGDHHQMDVWVNCGTALRPDYRRPWLSAWMDQRSTKIMGWCLYAHEPNQNSIISALRGGCLPYGIPERFYIDNGKDYDSYALQGHTKVQRHKGKIVLDADHIGGIFGALRCTAKHCWAFHGQSKRIERWFGTLEEKFGKRWPTYCGSSPAERPEGLFDQGGRRGRIHDAPMFEEYLQSLALWIDVEYAGRSGSEIKDLDGLSPNEVYDRCWNGHAKRTATEEILLLLLQKPTQPHKVGRLGVHYMGVHYQLPVDHHVTWQNKEVFLRVDERQINTVTVWTPDDRFICAATSIEDIPANATEQILRQAIRTQKQRTKAIRAYHDVRGLALQSPAEIATQMALQQQLEQQQAAAAAPPDPDRGPAAMRPVRPDLEAQSKEIQRQVQRLRPAVGMEAASEVVQEKPARFTYRPAESGEETGASGFRYIPAPRGEEGSHE